MANAKKDNDTEATSKKSAAKAAPKRTPPAKKAAKASGETPMVDTSLAARAAASSLLNRAVGGARPGSSSIKPRSESAAFRQMKEGLSQTASRGLDSALGSTQAEKKSNLPIGNQQTARSQTFSNVTRTGVPRRTAG